MNSYIKICLKSLGQTGTICPSSKYLIKEITQHIDFSKDITIVEFGTGDGCITEMLYEKMSPKSHLFSFELNEEFYHISKEKFQGVENVEVLNESALFFDTIKRLSDSGSVDYVISSLPLSLLEESEIDDLMSKVKGALKSEGKYIQYQYSLGKWRYLKNLFKKVKLDFTIRNLPPAVVYSCSGL